MPPSTRKALALFLFPLLGSASGILADATKMAFERGYAVWIASHWLGEKRLRFGEGCFDLAGICAAVLAPALVGRS